MKKLSSILLGTIMLLTLSACGGKDVQPPENQTSTSSESAADASASADHQAASKDTRADGQANALVVYFSVPETTSATNMTTEEDNSVVVIDGEVLGNTQYVAQLIQQNTGANLFRLEPATPYPTDHSTLVDLAAREQEEKARPAIAANIENLDAYDVIFLGYPNWWGDMPMILYTFLESNDLSGKTIIPFNTHGGSGFASTIGSIAKLQPDAVLVENGFSVSRNNVQDCADDVLAWLAEVGV